MDSGSYTWNVDESTFQQMKDSKPGRTFKSPTFDIAGLTWRVKTYPNGSSNKKEGKFQLYCSSVHMPSDWDHIECCINMQCHESLSGFSMYHPFKKGQSFGRSNLMSFSEVKTFQSLSLTFQIFVHRIVLKQDNRVFYERNTVASHQSAVWKIDNVMLEKLKSAYFEKSFYSEIYGGMYCFYLQRKEEHFALYLRLCALPKGKRKMDLSWTADLNAKGDDFEKVNTFSWSKELTIEGSGQNDWGNIEFLSIDDLMKSDQLMININITVNDDQKAIAHWNQLAQRQDNDDEKNESNTSDVFKTDSNQQSEERFLLMKARIDSLESAMESMSSSMKDVTTNMEQITSKMTALDTIETRLNRNNKQSMALQEQAAKAMQSKLEQMQQRMTSIDSKLKEVQKRTDGKIRRHSESNQSQSVEILAMMNQLKEEVAALREAQNQGDEELKEETEEMKLKKWMEDEVKLPQYFELLKEDGFDDLESVQDVTEDDLKAMGIDKTGHRRKIMKFVTKLKAKNNPSVSIPSSMAQQGHIPVAAAAYSFGIVEPAKVDAEGPNLVDTGH